LAKQSILVGPLWSRSSKRFRWLFPALALSCALLVVTQVAVLTHSHSANYGVHADCDFCPKNNKSDAVLAASFDSTARILPLRKLSASHSAPRKRTSLRIYIRAPPYDSLGSDFISHVRTIRTGLIT